MLPPFLGLKVARTPNNTILEGVFYYLRICAFFGSYPQLKRINKLGVALSPDQRLQRLFFWAVNGASICLFIFLIKKKVLVSLMLPPFLGLKVARTPNNTILEGVFYYLRICAFFGLFKQLST
jgi:hypothetical protein